jgi:hypothetical protein
LQVRLILLLCESQGQAVGGLVQHISGRVLLNYVHTYCSPSHITVLGQLQAFDANGTQNLEGMSLRLIHAIHLNFQRNGRRVERAPDGRQKNVVAFVLRGRDVL